MKQPELGKKIADLRKSKGLTQEELVELCNINVRTIQRIESGEVEPRSYTLKNILSALDYDFNEFKIDEGLTEKHFKWLNLTWIAGIIYFILGIPEGTLDVMRFMDEFKFGTDENTDWLISGGVDSITYLIVKTLVMISYALFLSGFWVIGENKNNWLLKLISASLITFVTITILYDIISLLNPSLENEVAYFGISITFGLLSIAFGSALIYLKRDLGILALIAGILEIIAGLFFLIVTPIGLLFQMPAELLEVMLIFKFLQLMKSNPSRHQFE